MPIISFSTSSTVSSQWRATENDTDPLLVWNSKQVAVQISSLVLNFILALGGNFLIAFTLVKKDQLVLPSNRLVFSLTASNFALALLVFPFTVVSSVHQKWLFGIFWCNFTAFLTVLVATASFLTIAVIAIDRYHAIVKPMMYTLTITNARSSIFLIIVWLLAFGCALPPLFGWSKFLYRESEAVCLVDWQNNIYYTAFLLIVSFLLPFTIMVICYYSIFQVARTKCRKIHIGSLAEVHNNLRLTSAVDNQKSVQRHSLSRKTSWLFPSYSSPAKGFRTICLVIGVFLLTCLPYIILSIIEASGHEHLLSQWLHIIALGLIFFSAASHPVIYGLYNRSIRKEIKSYLCHSNSRTSLGSSHHTLRRLSISSSLMDYSPFRFYRSSKSRRVSADYSSVSVEMTNQTYLRTLRRKGSQDSGAVMMESDVDSETSWGFHRWKRRLSAPSRLQHFTQLISQYQEMRQSSSHSSHPLPILHNLSLKAAQPSSKLNSSQLHDSSQETIKPLEPSEDVPDIPPINSLPMNKNILTKESIEMNRSVAHVDEGIVNDCIIEDLD